MSDYLYGRIWLFHPSGAKLELALPSNYPEEAFSYINECLTAGFLVSAPDLTGLDRLDVSYVVRGQVVNERGTTTRLYFYAAWAQQSSNMTVYLNTLEDVNKFERASGLIVNNIPLIKGKTPPQRDSLDFEHMAVAVNFTVSRRKVEDSGSPVGYRWELVDYISGGMPYNAPTSPKNGDYSAPTSIPSASPQNTAKNADEDTVDYEAQALNWFASNGISIVEVMRRLNLKKGALPAATDKDGWRKILSDYAALVKAAQS